MTDTPDMDDRNDVADAGREDELEALRGEIEQLRAESLRERADLDNQRKRLARDLDSARRFANERLLADLLPLFDAMEAGLVASGAVSQLFQKGYVLNERLLRPALVVVAE